MGKRIKVGLIGCGWFAQAVHLPILRRLPGVELVALAEPDRHLRQEFSRAVPSASVYADYREMLRIRDLDAVIVTSPTALHAEVAIAAVQLGNPLWFCKATSIATYSSAPGTTAVVPSEGQVVGSRYIGYEPDFDQRRDRV